MLRNFQLVIPVIDFRYETLSKHSGVVHYPESNGLERRISHPSVLIESSIRSVIAEQEGSTTQTQELKAAFSADFAKEYPSLEFKMAGMP